MNVCDNLFEYLVRGIQENWLQPAYCKWLDKVFRVVLEMVFLLSWIIDFLAGIVSSFGRVSNYNKYTICFFFNFIYFDLWSTWAILCENVCDNNI